MEKTEEILPWKYRLCMRHARRLLEKRSCG